MRTEDNKTHTQLAIAEGLPRSLQRRLTDAAVAYPIRPRRNFSSSFSKPPPDSELIIFAEAGHNRKSHLHGGCQLDSFRRRRIGGKSTRSS